MFKLLIRHNTMVQSITFYDKEYYKFLVSRWKDELKNSTPSTYDTSKENVND